MPPVDVKDFQRPASVRTPRPVALRNDRNRVGPRAGLGIIQNRDACLSAAKAKRQRQLRLGEIIKIILGDERNEALHENRRYGENKSYRWTC
jgi:hypothetical protein